MYHTYAYLEFLRNVNFIKGLDTGKLLGAVNFIKSQDTGRLPGTANFIKKRDTGNFHEIIKIVMTDVTTQNVTTTQNVINL